MQARGQITASLSLPHSTETPGPPPGSDEFRWLREAQGPVFQGSPSV